MLAASMLRCVLVLSSSLVLLLGPVGCAKKGDEHGGLASSGADSRSVASPGATVPPVLSATPASELADAASLDGTIAYDQARAYEANGQHWLARLVLEKKALGPDGTSREVELLATICNEQGDEACVGSCGSRLGRKLKLDGGGARVAINAGEHQEPDSDAARARDLLLAHRVGEARKILDPKVIDGTASREELRLLRTACREQGDRMCIALCDAKLK